MAEMSKKLGMLVLMLTSALGTGCCWFDQCGGCYNQCGGAYDPCTGLVYNQCDPYQGCRSKRISKKLHKDRCDCDKHDCDCRHESHHDGCNCHHGMTHTSGCPDCQSYGQPIYGEPIYGEPVYGEPIYGEPVETYYEPENYPELMVPHEAQPSKPVPAPPADEPEPLPMPEGSSIPPTSYEVPAPLEGPDVPVLQPYHGR
jgi:hypothetical protein